MTLESCRNYGGILQSIITNSPIQILRFKLYVVFLQYLTQKGLNFAQHIL